MAIVEIDAPLERRARWLKALRLAPISFSAEGQVLVNTDEIIEREAHRPEDAARPPSELAGV